MENICVVCKKSAEFCCSCDNSLLFCFNDFLKVHKNIKGSHLDIDLETLKYNKKFVNETKIKDKIIFPKVENLSNESKLKLDYTRYNIEETKIESFKFSKNKDEIQKQLKSIFNLFLEGHTDYITTVAVTSDNKYVISGSRDKTIRI